MKTFNILNPAAGQGKALEYKDSENAYITKGTHDATHFVRDAVAAESPVHFNVYGGDGTVNEVVNGLIGAKDASISIVPVGTGNDMLRTFEHTGRDISSLDVLTADGRYAVNAVNTGFDLDVVAKAAEFKKKPIISGSLAYILGVVSVFCKKFGKYMNVEYTDREGNLHTHSGKCTLTVCANGQFYGGGFRCAPAADISDGLIDLIIIKKVSRLRFLSLILGYKAGRHIDLEKGVPTKKFKKYIIYDRCRSVKISGISKICADGEIWDANEVCVDVIPSAVTIKKRNKE